MRSIAEKLFPGADDGAYTLPAEISELRAARDRLDAMTLPEPSTIDHASRAAVDDLIGGGNLDPAPLIATKNRHDEWQASVRVLADARREVHERLDATAHALADIIITNHLRPALADVAAELAQVADKLPADVTGQQLLLAAKPARDAWGQLEALSRRYYHLRGAQDVCGTLGSPSQYDGGQWFELDNLLDLWPGWPHRHNVPGAAIPPWPQNDPTRRLLWLAHNGARYVMLTGNERDQRWHNTYGAENEQRRLMQMAARANMGADFPDAA